jgi:hypothetical protein
MTLRHIRRSIDQGYEVYPGRIGGLRVRPGREIAAASRTRRGVAEPVTPVADPVKQLSRGHADIIRESLDGAKSMG